MANEETKKPEETKKKKELSKKAKKTIAAVVTIVVIIGLGVLGYFIWDANTFFSTNNAKVTGTTINIVPSTPGRLTRWTVNVGDAVTENEVIGRVENTSYLRSPVNGRVVKSSGVVNQMVSQATVVGVVANTQDMYIQANIEETSIMKIREGQKVSVQMDAFPFKTFEGTVSEIDMLTQDALGGSISFTTSGTYTKITKLIPVKIRLVDNIDLSLVLGTNAAIKIRLR